MYYCNNSKQVTKRLESWNKEDVWSTVSYWIVDKRIDWYFKEPIKAVSMKRNCERKKKKNEWSTFIERFSENEIHTTIHFLREM